MKYDKNGLIPVITQDCETKDVLMMAYMNEEAFNKTRETGRVYYYSRSKKRLWLKGETSGHYQYVKNISADCDKDCLLITVEQVGAACHTGSRTCFFNEPDDIAEVLLENDRDGINDVISKESRADVMKSLTGIIIDRMENPKEGSYTNYLFTKGLDKILKKVGEETAEVIIASKNPNKSELIYETADLMYHLSVLLVLRGLSWEDIYDELSQR